MYVCMYLCMCLCVPCKNTCLVPVLQGSSNSFVVLECATLNLPAFVFAELSDESSSDAE